MEWIAENTTESGTDGESRGALPALPGNPMIWILILSELAVFGAFFTIARAREPGVFDAAQAVLNRLLSGINTMVLITSGYAAALAMQARAADRSGRPQLAAAMERRGTDAVGATFRTLAGEEHEHADRVTAWSKALVGSAPGPGSFAWRLPVEIARSWEDLAESATLTPFGALSVAVMNEERAFFYTYVAAHSDADDVCRQAEALAREELRHAVLLRRARRTAWRREQVRDTTPVRPGAIRDMEELRSVACAVWIRAAEIQDDLARRLKRSGDDDSATVFNAVARNAKRIAAEAGKENDGVTTASAPAWAALPEAEGGTGRRMLEQALGTAERLCDIYGDMAGAADREDVLVRAQELQEVALRHLILITARLEQVGRD